MNKQNTNQIIKSVKSSILEGNRLINNANSENGSASVQTFKAIFRVILSLTLKVNSNSIIFIWYLFMNGYITH